MSSEVTVYGPEQIDLIKRLVCKDATDDELALFVQHCKRTGLDPFSRQIYAVKRNDKNAPGGKSMTIQVGIDGLRLIADRTERYCPGRQPTYEHDDKGGLVSATAYVRKLVGGTWHETAATAYWGEYVQTTPLWAKMPHVMLAKCAEALALRRAFPMETSGCYTDDEIGAEDSPRVAARPAQPAAPKQLPPPAAPAPVRSYLDTYRLDPPPHGDALEEYISAADDYLVSKGAAQKGDLERHLASEVRAEDGSAWPPDWKALKVEHVVWIWRTASAFARARMANHQRKGTTATA